MKTERTTKMAILVTSIRNYLQAQEENSREYATMYRRCYEGSDEEVTRKLNNWDWVHSSTRNYCLKGGL
ncbi:hypothetical protein ACFL0X_02705 [Nanoarchaeota archaeon]